MRKFCVISYIGVLLASAQHAAAVPAASNVSTSVAITPTGIRTLYTGSDGSLEYDWTMPTQGTQDSLGNIHIVSQLGAAHAELDVPIGFVTVSTHLRLQNATASVASDGSSVTYVLHFLAGSTSTTATLRASMSGKTLNADIQGDTPLVAAVYGNVLPGSNNVSLVKVPYYSGATLYFPDAKLFANFVFDWQNSHASEIDPMQAAYYPLTDGSRNVPKERLILNVSQNLPDVLPTINNPPSAYQSQVAGRTVIDIWNQSTFSRITDALKALGNSGVHDCVVLIHNWQQNGYDNAYPDAYPPSSAQGGQAQLAQAIAAGRNIGCYVGVHENYADYYPDASSFTTSDVARNGDGSLMLGWLNPTLQIQSYATRQTRILAHAAGESPAIHNGLNTNGSFVDVVSAATPWLHADMDATQSGAGLFSTVVNTNANLWNYERQTHGGPVFGEGLYHWFWSGLLDGVEAQFGVGLDPQAERNPLFVDFDVFKIHPLQVNHGMGMYDRWLTPGEDITRTDLMDAYRMQELIYGHAPYIEGSFWTNIYRVLQEQNLVSPVAQRYGTQVAVSTSYQVNGVWADAAAAIQANDWSRVAVQYANGDTITANAQAQPMSVGNLQIPQYGWVAQGTNLLAYTAMLNGFLGDYAQTATSFFANARNQSDLALSGTIAKPTVISFTQLASRSAAFQLQWQVLDGPQGANLNDFVHVVDGSGNMVAQADYTLSIPSPQWRPGQILTDTVPLSFASLPDGNYLLLAGLYSTQTGLRTQLSGVEYSDLRYNLGQITVSNRGQTISFQPQNSPALPVDARMNASGNILDFNTLKTDGMVSLNFNGTTWNLLAYPRFRNVVVQLNSSQFPIPASITCDATTLVPQAMNNGYWQLPIRGAQSCQW